VAFDVLFEICEFFLVAFIVFFLEVGVDALFVIEFVGVHGLAGLECLEFGLDKLELLFVGALIDADEVADEVWQFGLVGKFP
jgi:hypothetical protein